MQVLQCDAKGRLYLRESIRRRYGKRFVMMPTPGELLLVPVPEDPVSDLRAATSKVRGLSEKQLESLIADEAKRQVSVSDVC